MKYYVALICLTTLPAHTMFGVTTAAEGLLCGDTVQDGNEVGRQEGGSSETGASDGTGTPGEGAVPDEAGYPWRRMFLMGENP